MERFCSKCGTLVSGEGKFCPQCGAPMESAVSLDKTPVASNQSVSVNAQAPYTGNTQPQPYGNTYNTSSNSAQMPNYPQSSNVVNERTENMTMGQWLGTIILTTWFSIISIVLLFVWAFGDTPQPKKNYCRAMLIIQAIGVGLTILLYIGMFACIGMTAGGLEDFFNNYMYY